MRRVEAEDLIERYNKHADLTAKLKRILPNWQDPPIEMDNGWDVEITVEEVDDSTTDDG